MSRAMTMIGSLRLMRHVQFRRELLRSVCVVRSFSSVQEKPPPAGIRSGGNGLYDLLTKDEETLMEEQRAVSDRARDIANRIGKVKMKDTQFLEDILPSNTSSNFSIVVAGEFNAGKSSVINALVGHNLLDTGALPTTDSITVLTHNDTSSTSNLQGGLLWHQVKSMPEGIILVDTPGTNAVIVDHTPRTLKLLPTADLILFCTSADRPFPESERALLQSIQAYRKNIIVVINKMDVLDAAGGAYGKEEKQRVVDFVSDNASALLGGRPVVISISAKNALSSKLMTNANLWERSNFQELETFLKDSLTTETKIKAKLLNPLGVAEGVLVEGLESLKQEEQELEGDVATLNLLRHQFDSWAKEMVSDSKSFCTEIQEELVTEGTRVKRLVDRVGILSLMRLSLLDDVQLEKEWTRSMPLGTVDQVQENLFERIREMSERTSERAQSQGQAVVDYLGKRPSAKSKNIVGNIVAATQVQDMRSKLKEQMQASVKGVMSNHSELAAKKGTHHSLMQGAVLAAGLEGSALLSFVSSYMEMIDLVYGGAIGCASAAAGVLVVAQASRSVTQRYSKELGQLGTEVYDALEVVCDKELQKVNRRILDGVQPYSRYVQTEQDRIETLTKESEDAVSQAQSIRSRVNKLRHYD